MARRIHSWMVGVLLAAALAVGCAEQQPAGMEGPELSSFAEDHGAGFGVTVSVDRAEVRTVDRVEVTIEVTRPAGMPVTVVESDWSDPEWGGWTVAGRRSSEPWSMGDGRLGQRHVVVLEPFLEGAYRIPPVEVRTGAQSVATAALELRVVSVLDEEDAGRLAEAAPVINPGDERTGGTGLVVGAVLVTLGAFAVAWRLGWARGAPTDSPALTPLDALRRVAAGGGEDPDALGVVHRALEHLSPNAGDGLRSLAARCERARFAPGSSDDARAIAREALAVLEGGR